ncbi:MAG: mechanosensitive ion channel family protein [Methanomassiliicoccales archaeon]|nr:mechanosensitive ion channel family protein [Methanomassiliicoccales archaeon]
MEPAQETFVAASSGDWLTSYGWPILLLFTLCVVFLYIWSYLNKNLERMKAKEGRYMDADLATYLGRMAKAAMIITVLFLLGFVLSQTWGDFNDLLWEPYLTIFIQLAIIFMVVLFAGLIARILRNFSKRSRLRSAGKGVQGSSAMEFTSLLLSYIVYIGAAVLVLVVLLTFVSDIDAMEALSAFWEENGTKLEALVIFLVAVYLVIRLINAIFEDFKFRTKKFNPQVVDLFNSMVRYVFYLIAFMVTVFILFSVMNLEEVGMILIVTILVFISLGISLSYSTVKNIVAGLAIMNTEVFDLGDKVRLGSDLVCEIVEKNLTFTKVRTEDGETVSIPNSEIISERVLNYKRSLAHGISVAFEVPIEVSHGEVEGMVKRAVNAVEGLMKEPSPELFAMDIVGPKIRYEVNAYVLDAMRAKKARSDLLLSIQDALATDDKVRLKS